MNDFRRRAYDGLNAIWAGAPEGLEDRAARIVAPDAVWDISAPIGRLEGRAAIVAGLLQPLAAALPHVARRDEIFIGGDNIREEGGQWVAAITHYVGNFRGGLWGIPPSDHLVFLRAGEFYRVDDGQITKARIILDLPDLMRQAGLKVYAGREGVGTEMLFPGPATHDGVLPGARDRSKASLDLVEHMLGALRGYDPETMSSPSQTGKDGTWADDMLWYGPGGIGSNSRWDGFVADHRTSFLTAFPDRVGGNHYCRIGDGDYAAVSGWPSMTMTHAGDYLGEAATGKALTLRVMDFYRCRHGGPEGPRIAENWVLLDYVDLFEQIGVDLIGRAVAGGA